MSTPPRRRAPGEPLRLLFYKKTLEWPFKSGHDVHTFHMLKALAELGHEVGLVTASELPKEPLANVRLAFHETMRDAPACAETPIAMSALQERFRSYWGMTRQDLSRFAAVVRRSQVDAVIVSGLDVLPLLPAVQGPVRIWYAADEWLLHHLSQVQVFAPASWSNVREGAIKAAYERAFASVVDRAWAVTPADARAFRLAAGFSAVDVLPNGVDAERFAPTGEAEEPDTAVFWGRLDFGPNVQALEWFCSHVWPAVRAKRPAARLSIIGFCVTPPVRALADIPGVSIEADVPDVRPLVAAQAVVVLPFVSGFGIKNKLLEAAALGKAILASPHACRGLSPNAPFTPVTSTNDWVARLTALWDNEEERRLLGQRARAWATAEHTWPAVARHAVRGIEESLGSRETSLRERA